jgi:Bax protein
MKQKIKTIIQTLMAVTVILFVSGIWYVVSDEKNEALVTKQEIEIEKAVETLESITTHTLPNFERSNNQTFIDSTVACVNYIYNTTTNVFPVNMELLVAQAALESAWGNSRFAIEGRNLFGIRTYDLREPHMLPSNNPKKWGVKVYMHECDSVQHYINILNKGTKFEEYRKLKHDEDVNDPYKLVMTLDAYASDKNYFDKVKSIIKMLREDYTLKSE